MSDQYRFIEIAQQMIDRLPHDDNCAINYSALISCNCRKMDLQRELHGLAQQTMERQDFAGHLTPIYNAEPRCHEDDFETIGRCQ